MRSELNGKVIGGIVAILVVIIALLAWKTLGPTPASDIIARTPQQMRQLDQQHGQSVQDIRAEQMHH